MPRRKVVAKREILPDPVYNDFIVAKFINRVMKSGKKSVAQHIVYGAFNKLEERWKARAKTGNAPKDASEEGEGGSEGGEGSVSSAVDLFMLALQNVRPTVEVKARRVSGSTYQVPVEVRSERREALAMHWILESAKSRGEKGMVLRLAGELLDAVEHKGGAVKKRETTHQMAKANQAFAHLAGR
jgi:small subunit ribosomal protein S7